MSTTYAGCGRPMTQTQKTRRLVRTIQAVWREVDEDYLTLYLAGQIPSAEVADLARSIGQSQRLTDSALRWLSMEYRVAMEILGHAHTIRHYRPDLMTRAADSGGRLVEWMTDPQHIRDLTADSMAAGVRHWARIVAHDVTEAILPRHLCGAWEGIDVWTTWAADRRRLARRDLEDE